MQLAMGIDPLVIQAAARSGTDRYPYATWMPIPESFTQDAIRPYNMIWHSMAGPNLTSIEALWAYINRPDITGEPTFILDMAGRMAQITECDVRADNNYKANSWWVGNERRGAISVETQDFGYPTLPTTPWTWEQVCQLAGLAAFANIRYGLPLQRCETWDGPGIDGHRKFQQWSKFVGKTCPGQLRYEQIDGIINIAYQIANYTEEGTDMRVQYIQVTGDSAVYQITGGFASWVDGPDAGNAIQESIALGLADPIKQVPKRFLAVLTLLGPAPSTPFQGTTRATDFANQVL